MLYYIIYIIYMYIYIWRGGVGWGIPLLLSH